MQSAPVAPAITSPPPAAKAFSYAVRVYWEDTDAGGVVFYANYLKFFERARTEWLRLLGLGQQRLRAETGAIFVVTETRVRYHAPARLDDLLEVSVELRRHGSASMTIFQQARRGGALVADGEIRIGCVDDGSFRPRRLPSEVMAILPVPAAATAAATESGRQGPRRGAPLAAGGQAERS